VNAGEQASPLATRTEFLQARSAPGCADHEHAASRVTNPVFGDEDIELARISRHLSPALLGKELAQLDQPANVFITHVKPGELDAGQVMQVG